MSAMSRASTTHHKSRLKYRWHRLPYVHHLHSTEKAKSKRVRFEPVKWLLGSPRYAAAAAHLAVISSSWPFSMRSICIVKNDTSGALPNFLFSHQSVQYPLLNRHTPTEECKRLTFLSTAASHGRSRAATTCGFHAANCRWKAAPGNHAGTKRNQGSVCTRYVPG